MYLAVSLIICLILAGLGYLAHLNKLPVAHRFLHIRSVVVTVLFSLLAMVFFANILQMLNKVLTQKSVQSVLFYIMPTANVSAAFFWMVGLLACLVLAVLYLITSVVVCNVWMRPLSANKNYLSLKSPVEKLLNRLSFVFYDADGTLKSVSEHAGKWIKFFRRAFGIILIVIAVLIPVYLHFGWMLITDAFLAKIVKSLFMIPLIAYYVLRQTEIYLVGDVKDSTAEEQTENADLHQVGDFSVFVPLFAHYFEDNALISTFKFDTAETLEKGHYSGPDNAQLERTQDKEMLEAVCRSANNAIHPLSPHYNDAVLDLINNRSVAVCDSFRGEFIVYYLAYLQQNLYKRRTTLIICDTMQQVANVKAQYTDVFRRINKLHHIWHISDIDTLTEETDVLVCTEEQLMNTGSQNAFHFFFSRIHDVAVLDTYALLSRNNAFVFRFFNTLKRKHANFAFFLPENNVDMKNALESRLDIELNIYENFNVKPNTYVMCWRGESAFKTQKVISTQLYDDFGIAYTIALIAGKYDVERVNIHAPEDIPLKTYAGIVHNYEREIADSIFKRDNVIIDSVVRHNPIIVSDKDALTFDIYYDGNKNLLDVARIALTDCSQLASMIHIISRPYMLRDYFAHKVAALNDRNSGVQYLVPAYYSHEHKAPSLALLIKLRETGMTCEQIVLYMRGFGIEKESVEELLSYALTQAFGDTVDKNVYQLFTFGSSEINEFENNAYNYTRFVKLTSESLYMRAVAESVHYVKVEGDCNEMLPINVNSVYNRFLPGQIFSFGGNRYIINSIRNGVMNVTAEDTLEYEPEYLNNYRFICDDLQVKEAGVYTANHIACDMLEGTVHRSTVGYFTLFNGLDFNSVEHENYTHYIELDTPIEETKHARVLRMTIDFPIGEAYEKAAALLVTLLRGAFETLIPNNYKDVAVVSNMNAAIFDEVDCAEEDESAGHLRKDPVPSDWLEEKDYYIAPSNLLKTYLLTALEDNCFDGNNSEMLHLFIIDFGEYENGVIDAIGKDVQRILGVIHSYLDWHIHQPNARHAYLHFGLNQMPEVFDLVGVKACLERILLHTPQPAHLMNGVMEITQYTNVEFCSFCGRPIIAAGWKFADDRMMCRDCHKHITTAKDEINKVLKKAYETLESYYSITLPQNIRVKFKNADSIRRAAGELPDGRIIGIYQPRTKEIWIERGGPVPCVLSTLIHELTHAWQDANLGPELNNDPDKQYIIEGHATYVEIECLKRLGQTVYSGFTERCVLAKNDDVYAKGLRFWQDFLKRRSDKNIFNHIREL